MRTLFIFCATVLLASGTVAQVEDLPIVNQRVVAFVRENMGRQVGRGECWDLAAGALNAAGARWDGYHGFGRPVDPEHGPVLPGDIVQFEGVEFRWKEGSEVHTVRMSHHTAVVMESRSPGVYVIAQQNTRTTGRRTSTGDLVLSRRIKGHIKFYRPIEQRSGPE